MSFDHPNSLWLLVILPFILIYQIFFRKYKRCLVPCLQLWGGKTADRWSWFKSRILLLLLSTLLFVLLVFALADPVTGVAKQRFIIILDSSSSMLTREAKGTRWQQSLDIVYHYFSRSEGTLLVTSPKPRVIKLDDLPLLKPEGRGNADEAIALAADLAKGTDDKSIVITDGAGPAWRKLLPGLGRLYRVHIVGVATENKGIFLKQAYRFSQGMLISVKFKNFGRKRQILQARWQFEAQANNVAPLNLASVGSAAETVLNPHISISLSPLQEVSRTIYFPYAGKGRFICRSEEDAYLYDNLLSYPVPGQEKAKISIITRRPRPYLLAALVAYSNLVDKKASGVSDGPVPSGDYDLAIVCDKYSGAPPAKNLLLWGYNPFSRSNHKKPSEVCWGVNKLHPLSRYLDLSGLRFKESPGQIVTKNDKVIAYGNQGPLIWEGGYKGIRYIYVDFSLENSQFPLLSSFPIFIHNVLLWALNRSEETSLPVTLNDEEESDIAPSIAFDQDILTFAAGKKHWRSTLLAAAGICCVFWGFLEFLSLLIQAK